MEAEDARAQAEARERIEALNNANGVLDNSTPNEIEKRYLPEGHRFPKLYEFDGITTDFWNYPKRGEPERIKMCAGYISIIGRGDTIEDNTAYMDIEYSVGDRYVHKIIPKLDALSPKGVMELVSKGLHMEDAHARLLNKYIFEYCLLNDVQIPVNIVVKRNGWKNDNLYVCGNRGIMPDGIIKVAHTNEDISENMVTSGTYEEWIEAVEDMLKYEVVRLKIYVALTGAILSMLKVGNFIFDNYDLSGRLKTMTCHIGMSVYGRPDKLERSADSTINGIEGIAALTMDGCAFFDETSKASQEDLDKFVYTVGNGRPKQRMQQTTELHRADEFVGTYMTTGEKPIIADNSNGGIDARLIEYNGGIYETYEKAEYVKNAIIENHGHMIEKFVQYVMNNRTGIINRHRDISNEYGGECGKDVRKARQYAAVAMAGEIFEEIVSDDVTLEIAAVDMLHELLKKSTHEISNIPVHIRALQALNDWYSRNFAAFVDRNDENGLKNLPTYAKIEGYYDKNNIYLPPTYFNTTMITLGYDVGMIKQEWVKLGITKESKNGGQHRPMQTRPNIFGSQEWMITLNKQVMQIILHGETYDSSIKKDKEDYPFEPKNIKVGLSQAQRDYIKLIRATLLNYHNHNDKQPMNEKELSIKVNNEHNINGETLAECIKIMSERGEIIKPTKNFIRYIQ